MTKAVIMEFAEGVDNFCNHCLNDGYDVRQPCTVFVIMDLFVIRELEQTAICACDKHKALILEGGVKYD